MSDALEARRVACPYCGEPVETVLDAVEAGVRYTEDCPVCCRPIEFTVLAAADGALDVRAVRETE